MKSTNRIAPQTIWTGSFITDPVSLLKSAMALTVHLADREQAGEYRCSTSEGSMTIIVTTGPRTSWTFRLLLILEQLNVCSLLFYFHFDSKWQKERRLDSVNLIGIRHDASVVSGALIT